MGLKAADDLAADESGCLPSSGSSGAVLRAVDEIGGNAPKRIRRASVPVGATIAALIATAMLVGLAIAYSLVAMESDRLSGERRIAVRAALDSVRNEFADIVLRVHTRLGRTGIGQLPGALAGQATIRGAGGDHWRFSVAALVVAGNDTIVAASAPAARDLAPELLGWLHGIRHVQFDAEAAGDQAARRGSHDGIVSSDVVALRGGPRFIAVAELGAAAASAHDTQFLIVTAPLDPAMVKGMGQSAGVDALRIDDSAERQGREAHPLINRNGRIVGWLAWAEPRAAPQAVASLLPLLLVVAAALAGFTLLSILLVVRAMRRLRESEAKALRLAYVDALTHVANRRGILDCLTRALRERGAGQVVTFAYLDLDRFKDVNDTLGHRCGDQLLAGVAARMSAAFAPPGTCGRTGGDEFAAVIVSENIQTALDAANAAIKAVADGFAIDGEVVQIGASIGLASAPDDGESADAVMHRADLALREAKRRGRGCVVRFASGMEHDEEERQFVTRELRRALSENALCVHYQPIVAADGLQVIGVEALLRWAHPVRGDIAPSVFVPIAEQTGMMMELGDFVMRTAFADAMYWPDVYIAVNVSPVQMRDARFIGMVARAIECAGISPSRVVLEITEGLLIDNPEEAKERLEMLRSLRVRVALDDFGSGYSSMTYLQCLPIDKLKIDRQFVAPLGRSQNAGAVLQAMMTLGRAFGLTVVCEGVETQEQRILLRLAGCDEMQGYLFARPGPRSTIDRILAVQARLPAISPTADSVVSVVA